MTSQGVLGGFTVLLLSTIPGWAADYVSPEGVAPDLCAVSGFNGKLHAQGGYYDAEGSDDHSQFQGVGSLSFPLGCLLGAQIDAGAGKFGDFDALGVGGHIFLRDPASYLIGIHTTYENWDLDVFGNNVGVWRVGPEVELYFSKISLEAWAGLQDSEDHDATFFARLTAGIYLYENLRLAAGWRHSDEVDSGVVSAEWQLTDLPLSLTAEAEVGEDDFTSVTAGVKFYFGGASHALIDRHRQDDPADGLFDFLGAAAELGESPKGDECRDETVSDTCCLDACCADQACDFTVTVE
jgi:hypothetical protein